MSEYEIKSISENELEKCTDVIRKGFSTVAKDFGLTAENCATNVAFIKTERLISDFNKGNLMYGLFINDKIVGFMQLAKNSDKQFELEKLTVLPEYRHFGYGKVLLDFAKNKAIELDVDKITIGIINENIVLKEWYLSNGFIHTGIRQFKHLPFTVGFMELEV